MNDATSLGARFAALVLRLGGHDDGRTFARLFAAWSSPERHYHDALHLTECLDEVDRLTPSPARDRIELALWYHDAIYVPGTSGNEHESAELLVRDATSMGISESCARAVAALVEATAHGVVDVTGDEAALVVDIDLSILGRDPDRFMAFDYAVEKEFHAIPTPAFRQGRARFLAHMLAQPIYRTPAFRERFEAKARANVTGLLRSERYTKYGAP